MGLFLGNLSFFDDTMGIDSGFIFTKLVKYHEILTEFQKDVPFR